MTLKEHARILYRENEHRKRPHLVKWETVCHSKLDGGIGLRRNKAFIMKLGWGIIHDSNSLWAGTVLRGKHSRIKDCIPHVQAKGKDSRYGKQSVRSGFM